MGCECGLGGNQFLYMEANIRHLCRLIPIILDSQDSHLLANGVHIIFGAPDLKKTCNIVRNEWLLGAVHALAESGEGANYVRSRPEA